MKVPIKALLGIVMLSLCVSAFAQEDAEFGMLGLEFGGGNFGGNITYGDIIADNTYLCWSTILNTAPAGFLSAGLRWYALENLILGADLGFGDYGTRDTDSSIKDNWCLTGSAIIAYNLKNISLDGVIIALRADVYFIQPTKSYISFVIDIGGKYTKSSDTTTAPDSAPATQEYVYPLQEPTVSSIQSAAEWVHNHIAYDYAKQKNDDWYLLSPEQVLKTNGGVCRDMVVLTMKIVYDSLGIKPNYVSIKVPGTPGHAILEYNGRYFDPTNLRTYTRSSISVSEIITYDETMRYIGRQLK